MDGFKDTTRMKYMMGGDVKAYKTGGPAKMAMGGTYNEKGKRATLAEMEAEDRRMGSSMPAKKAVGPSSVAVSKVLSAMTKKAGARGMGAMSNRDMQMAKEAAKKTVPSYSDRPMIRRSKGGLTAMPKGKC